MNRELSLASVKKRLQPYIGEFTAFKASPKEYSRSVWRGENLIARKALQMQNKIESFRSDEQAEQEFVKVVNRYFQIIIINNNGKKSNFFQENKKFENQAIDATVALLFLKARKKGAKKFDPEKELRQIRAVYHNLMGDYAAMVTAAGKTAAVMPITTNTMAFVEPVNRAGQPTIIDSSSDDANTRDLAKKVELYKTIMLEVLQRSDIHQLRKYVVKEKLKTAPSEIEEKKKEVRGNNLEGFFTQKPSYLDQTRRSSAKIGFQNHSPIVFDSTLVYQEILDKLLFPERYQQTLPVKERKQLKKSNEFNQINAFNKAAEYMRVVLPVTYFDEAHLLKGPYVMSTGNKEKREKIRIDTKFEPHLQILSDYIILKIIDKKFEDTTLYKFEGQRYYLSSKGKKELIRLRRNLNLHKVEIKTIIETEIKSACKFKGKNWQEEVFKYFNQYWKANNGRINELVPEVDEDSLTGLKKSERISPADQLLVTMSENFLNSTKILKKGVDYLTPELLRDSIRGMTLQGHAFTGDVPFYLNIKENKFRLPKEKNLITQINFSTWLALVAQGKVIALSNDLYYTDPSSGKREISPLGNMLEKFTDGLVIDLAPKEKSSPIPQPIVSANFQLMMERVESDILNQLKLDQKRPEMIVCWSEQTGKQLYDELKLKNKNLKIVLINSQTSNFKADLFQKQFSNYKFDILITTGRKSFAADFKDKNDEFTDFRVNVINPETNFQVGQALGRRRLEKQQTDFSIYFDRDTILDLGTILNKKSQFNFLPLLFKTTTYEEFEKLVNKASSGVTNFSSTDQEKLKKDIFEVLRRNQKKNVGDWEKQVTFESIFIRNITPFIREKKRELFDSVWRKAYLPLNHVIEDRLKVGLANSNLSELPITDQKALEARVVNQAMDHFADIDESIYSHFQNLLMNLPFLTNLSQNELVQQKWLIDEMEKVINNEFLPRWEADLKDSNSRYMVQELDQVIQESIDTENDILKFIKSQLSSQNLDLSKIADKYILYSPEFVADKSGRSFPDVPPGIAEQIGCHSQRFFIKNRTIHLFDEESQKFYPILSESFEEKLVELNRETLEQVTFKNKKYIDLYYPNKDTTRFIRIVLKN